MFWRADWLGRRQESRPLSGPLEGRTGIWIPLPTSSRSTAFIVPSRSNCSKTNRTTPWACSSGSNARPAPSRTYPIGPLLASSPRRAF